jgi:hypothetical protein
MMKRGEKRWRWALCRLHVMWCSNVIDSGTRFKETRLKVNLEGEFRHSPLSAL